MLTKYFGDKIMAKFASLYATVGEVNVVYIRTIKLSYVLEI